MGVKFDSTSDYYVILGVPDTATSNEIKAGFRRATLRHHPDRGGTHEDMLRILNAWEVLRDPSTRAAYDATRRQPLKPTVLQQWETLGSKPKANAERAAQEYPRKWKDFVRWRDGFIGDVAATRYGKERHGDYYLPTATGWTGKVFIYAGFSLGVILAYHLMAPGKGRTESTIETLFRVMVPCLVGSYVGAWIGKWCHAMLRAGITDGEETVCRSCGQRLRLPRSTKVLVVTCPKCRERWEEVPNRPDSYNLLPDSPETLPRVEGYRCPTCSSLSNRCMGKLHDGIIVRCADCETLFVNAYSGSERISSAASPNSLRATRPGPRGGPQ